MIFMYGSIDEFSNIVGPGTYLDSARLRGKVAVD